jgi:hypothetical protein
MGDGRVPSDPAMLSLYLGSRERSAVSAEKLVHARLLLDDLSGWACLLDDLVRGRDVSKHILQWRAVDGRESRRLGWSTPRRIIGIGHA